MTYHILNVDGSRERFTPHAKRPGLEEMQGIVGGYIERVRVKGGDLWVNEDGWSLALPLNPGASELAGQQIVGRCLYAMRSLRKAAAR